MVTNNMRKIYHVFYSYLFFLVISSEFNKEILLCKVRWLDHAMNVTFEVPVLNGRGKI